MSVVFDTIHWLWLSQEEFNTLPEKSSDFRIVSISKQYIEEGSEVLKQKTKEYSFNEKNQKLYKKLTEDELGLECLQIFFTNILDTLARIVYHIAMVFVHIGEMIVAMDCSSVAFTSLGCLISGDFFEIFRSIHYSIAIQIAAIEGIFSDSVRGAMKIELFERLLNRELSRKDDFFRSYRDPKKSGQNPETFGFYSAYNLQPRGSLETVEGAAKDTVMFKGEDKPKFVKNSMKASTSVSGEEKSIFPLIPALYGQAIKLTEGCVC